VDRLAGLARTTAEELNRMLSRQTRHRRGVVPGGSAAEGGGPARAIRAVDVALAQVLGVLLAEPSYYDSIRQSVGPGDFADPQTRALAEPVFELASAGELSLTALLRRVESPALANLATELADRVARMGEALRTSEIAGKTQPSDEELRIIGSRGRDLRRGGN